MATPSIEQIDIAVGEVPYMSLRQAQILSSLWDEAPPGNILELGFAHGKGSAYLGALAAKRNARAVCVDNKSALARTPFAEETIERAGVSEHVDLVFSDTGYNWWMMRQIEQGSAQKFSMVYLDGAHDWNVDALAVLLLNYFVVPNAILVLDDLDWNYSLSEAPDVIAMREDMPEDVATEPHVRKIWELIIQRDPLWGDFREEGQWAIARRVGEAHMRDHLERVIVRPSFGESVLLLRSRVAQSVAKFRK